MFGSLIVLALVSAPPAHAAQSEAGKATSLTGSLQGLISSDDYPAQALDRNEEGTVGYRLRVDAQGKVADCVIEISSGSGWLDSQTCRLMWLRARFSPARDANGKAVESETRARVTWAIANDPVAAIERFNRSTVHAVDGKPMLCRVEHSAGGEMPTVNTMACPEEASDAAQRAAGLKSADVIVEDQFALASPPTSPARAGDRVIIRQVARLDFDAAGKLASCTLVELVGKLGPNAPGLCVVTTKRFLPRAGKSGAPEPFTAYQASTVIVRPD